MSKKRKRVKDQNIDISATETIDADLLTLHEYINLLVAQKKIKPWYRTAVHAFFVSNGAKDIEERNKLDDLFKKF